MLADRVGPRKAWIFTFQVVILLCLAGWTMLDPSAQLVMVVGLGLIIAIASASQDITIDAFRIEQVDTGEREVMAAGAAMAVIGWWSGFKLGGLVTLFVADAFEAQGIANYWQMTFLVIMLMIVATNIALMLVPENKPENKAAPGRIQMGAAQLAEWFNDTLLRPLTSFFRNNGVSIALGLLGFIFCSKSVKPSWARCRLSSIVKSVSRNRISGFIRKGWAGLQPLSSPLSGAGFRCVCTVPCLLPVSPWRQRTCCSASSPRR